MIDEPTDEATGKSDNGDTLEDVGRQEEDYMRERLRQELGREPTEEEVSAWLRRHTEGY